MKQLIITIGTILLTSSLYSQGGVGINNNGSAPNTSAMLDVASTDKGLLIPRVSLTSTTDATTITNGNVTSLLVYNTVTIADVVPGYYYWDGTVWKTIGGNDADADPTNEIQDLQLAGNNLTITNNGTPTTIDLSSYLDNTDDQNIDSVILNGNNLTVYIEDGTSSAVDLSSLSDHDWYEVGGTTAPDNITDDIYTQGNVGIGMNASPLEKLHVNGEIRNNGLVMFGTNNAYKGVTDAAHIYGSSATGGVYPFNGGGNLILQSRRFDTRDILFVTGQNATPRMVIKGTGFTGIGTTTPNAKLNVFTQISGTGFTPSPQADEISIENNSNSGLSIGTENNGNFYVGNSTTNDLGQLTYNTLDNSWRIATNSAEKIRILSNGDLGIGTTTPTNKLDINGDLRVQTIAQGTGADVALVADANGVVKQVAPYVPPGAVISFAMATAPAGWLICDGSAVSRTTYADLFASIGTTYGAGNNTTTFNLPDLRGEFIRGSDNGRGLDAGRAHGSVQSGTLVGADVDGVSTTNGLGLYTINPSSGFDLLGADPTNAINLATYQTNNVGFLNLGPQAGGTYASRPDLFGISRPRNIAMNYCIRF